MCTSSDFSDYRLRCGHLDYNPNKEALLQWRKPFSKGTRMRPLIVDSSMTSMGGTFYPTGYVFALFPDEDSTRHAAAALDTIDHKGELSYGDPATVMQEVVRTLGSVDAPLPSVGAEGDMVRRIADLAGAGYHGLLIFLDNQDSIEAVVQAIAPAGAATAFYYRTFIIEDLIAPPMPEDKTQAVVVGTHAAVA